MKKCFFKSIAYVVIVAIFNMPFSTIAYGIGNSSDTDGAFPSSHTAIRPSSENSCLIQKLGNFISIPMVGEWFSAQDACRLEVASTSMKLWNADYIMHSDHPYFKTLWKSIGKSYKDYIPDNEWKTLEEGDGLFIKEYLKKQHLRVLVNASSDLSAIERIIRTYDLGPSKYPAVRNSIIDDEWLSDEWLSLNRFINICGGKVLEEGYYQGHQVLIKGILNGLTYGLYGYPEDSEEGRAFNDSLVALGNPKAIKRKIEGLARGRHGYPQNPEEARAFNDSLVALGNPEAIKRKIEGLARRRDGYQKSLEEARAFNDFLVALGNPKAIERKINGFSSGTHGYQKSLEEVRKFNDSLVTLGNPEAIERKIEGLAGGTYGYPENPEEAKAFNDSLVALGDPQAIERKINGFASGRHGYPQNPEEARAFNDSLVALGNPEAIERKIHGFMHGLYGYPEDSEEARAFNDSLVALGDPQAIERKIHGLMHGLYGYPQNPEEARAFNDSLVALGDPQAIERKIHGFMHGLYGYPQNPEEANNLLNSLLAQFFCATDNPDFQEKHLWLIQKRWSYLGSNYIYSNYDDNNFIDSLISHKRSSLRIGGLSLPALGKALKALGLKYELAWYKNNEDNLKDATRSLILESFIPY